MSLEEVENLLRASRWKDADIKTANCLLRYTQRRQGNWIRVEDIDRIPCECLYNLDQLWLSYSEGKFGFSVQESIYQNIEKDIVVGLREDLQRFVSKFMDGNSGKPSDKRIFCIFENLNQTLGWNKDFSQLDRDILSITPTGYFPYSIWCYLDNQKVNISMGDLVKMWGVRGIPGSMPRYLYVLYSRLFTRIKICSNSVEELSVHNMDYVKELSDLPVYEPTVFFNIEYRENLIYISSTKTNTSFFVNNDEGLWQVLSSRIQQGKIELTKSEFTRLYHQRVKDLKT
ncbi:MAG: GUN4 domain-containing protein [Cyanobacteriota bacterium]